MIIWANKTTPSRYQFCQTKHIKPHKKLDCRHEEREENSVASQSWTWLLGLHLLCGSQAVYIFLRFVFATNKLLIYVCNFSKRKIFCTGVRFRRHANGIWNYWWKLLTIWTRVVKIPGKTPARPAGSSDLRRRHPRRSHRPNSTKRRLSIITVTLQTFTQITQQRRTSAGRKKKTTTDN